MTHWTEEFFGGAWNIIQRSPELRRKAVDEAAFLEEALGLTPHSRVADVPCGDGRILLELARMGHRVVGLDACRRSVRRARDRVRRSGVEACVRLGDMRATGLEPGFDAAVSWGGSFGYFSDEENEAVLRELVRLTRPGGAVLVESVGRPYVLRHFLKEVEHSVGDLTAVSRNRWDAATERLEGRWTFRRRDTVERSRTRMRLYTLGQMKRLLERAGAPLEVAFGGIDGEPYRSSSRRMIVVGRRS
ncbi:MAG: methyltransferase domain-containing protein [Candidatus Eisenbacteria bacterium]|nr:methyltransferase domain-containing protein [Candidatus Eisenbacteria bacterium]